MENVEGSVAIGDAGILDARPPQLGRGRTAVEAACQAATTALDMLLGLLTVAAPSDDRSIALAHSQLDMTLAGVRRETCATLADVRAKLCVFLQLDRIFPSDDPQLQIFIRDLARDMADFLEDENVH